MKAVNQRIAGYRKLANLNQTEMAEKLGIKCSTYSQMERQGIVTAERLFKMAEIFGVSVCELYKGYEPCREEGIAEASDLVINQPAPQKPEKEIFIVTKKEEKLLKIIRNFSKSNYDKTIQFIEDLYKEEKN